VNQDMQQTMIAMLTTINNHISIFLISDEIYKVAVSSDDAERKIMARSEIQDYINTTILKKEVVATFKLAQTLFGDCVNDALTVSDCPTVSELEELAETEDYSQFL
jgi:hypothetical protein